LPLYERKLPLPRHRGAVLGLPVSHAIATAWNWQTSFVVLGAADLIIARPDIRALPTLPGAPAQTSADAGAGGLVSTVHTSVITLGVVAGSAIGGVVISTTGDTTASAAMWTGAILAVLATVVLGAHTHDREGVRAVSPQAARADAPPRHRPDVRAPRGRVTYRAAPLAPEPGRPHPLTPVKEHWSPTGPQKRSRAGLGCLRNRP
jgi:hypothetical protein